MGIVFYRGQMGFVLLVAFFNLTIDHVAVCLQSWRCRLDTLNIDINRIIVDLAIIVNAVN